MIRFTVNSGQLTSHARRFIADMESPDGIMAKHIYLGMEVVYARVTDRLKNAFPRTHRRFINSNAHYTDQAAPKVVKSKIKEVLESEKSGNYSLTNYNGFFQFGLGNVKDLDAFTDEVLISSLKLQRGELSEAGRPVGHRMMYSVWSIIEFGAKPHTIKPVTQGVRHLMFFSHKLNQAVLASGTSHPGQSGKHIFLRKEQEIYKHDMGAIEMAIKRGLRSQILTYFGKIAR